MKRNGYLEGDKNGQGLRMTLPRIAFLGLAHGFLLIVINHVSIMIWGNPQGLSFGITLYYSITSLGVLGFFLLVLSKFIRPKTALMMSIAMIASVAFWLFPGVQAPSYYAIFIGSAAFFTLLWFLEIDA